MKKYIFLDIDGVIATPESIENGLWGLVDSKQDLLGDIIKHTNADIVLSSSWRLHTVEDTIHHMNAKGFRYSDEIVGVTIRAYQYIKGVHLSIPRGVEIKQWLDVNVHKQNGMWQKKEIGIDYNYVILDDDNDMLLTQGPHFLRCKSEEGLTEDHVLKATKILNNLL